MSISETNAPQQSEDFENRFPLIQWRRDFLARRDIHNGVPDGRPLYAYRCSNDEFIELCSLLKLAEKKLSGNGVFLGFAKGSEELFVLFCAEWWRREFSGGVGKWDPIVKTLNWQASEYKDRIALVRDGLRKWKRKLIQTKSGNQFLLTVACEGGIPVNALGAQNTSFKSFLKAIIAEYSKSVFSGSYISEIATKHKNRLPTSWQQDHVIFLSGQLVEKVWHFSKDIDFQDDPIESLNRKFPNWLQSLPLVLNDAQAKSLINTLLKTAQKSNQVSNKVIKLDRFLENYSGKWHLTSTLHLPNELSSNELKRILIGHSEIPFPERMEIFRANGSERFLIARLSRFGDSYNVRPTAAAVRKNDKNASNEFQLLLTSKNLPDVPLSVIGGDALNDDIPWIFESLDEGTRLLRLISQAGGQCSNDTCYVVALESSINHSPGEYIPESIGEFNGRNIYEVTKAIRVKDETSYAHFLIEPNIEKIGIRDYHLTGTREYFPEADIPLYRGLPMIHLLDEDRVSPVPKAELFWRIIGEKEWQSFKSVNASGSVELRHIKDGLSLGSWRVGVLRDDLQVKVVPLENHSGEVTITGTGLLPVSFMGHDDLIVEESKTKLNHFSLVRKNANISRIRLKISWVTGGQIKVGIPFPAMGARFADKTDNRLNDWSELSVSRLQGFYAQAVYPNQYSKKYYLRCSLRSSAPHCKAIKYHNFDYPLLGDKNCISELPLQQIQRQIQRLFAISGGIDDRVVISIHEGGKDKELCAITVKQFEADLIVDSFTQIIGFNAPRAVVENYAGIRLRLLSLTDYNKEDIYLEWNETRQGWSYNAEIVCGGDIYFAVLDSEGSYSVRPAILNNQEEICSENLSLLAKCLIIPNSRERKIRLNRLFADLLESNDEQDWGDLSSHLCHFKGVHPNGVDLIEAVTENPAIMASLLIRSFLNDELKEYLSIICDEMPFDWWMIQISYWEHAIDHYLDSLSPLNEEHKQLIIKQIALKLGEFTKDNEAINVATEVIYKKMGMLPDKGSALHDAQQFSLKENWARLDLICRSKFINMIGDEYWPQISETNEIQAKLSLDVARLIQWPAGAMVGYQKSILQMPVAVAAKLQDKKNLSPAESIAAIAAKNFHSEAFSTLLRASQAILWVSSKGKNSVK